MEIQLSVNFCGFEDYNSAAFKKHVILVVLEPNVTVGTMYSEDEDIEDGIYFVVFTVNLICLSCFK